MKSKLQIVKEIQKNQTYQSIRFNNKHISDQHVKSAIDEFFPKLFCQQKWKQITFFIRAMKDQQFYKKIKSMIQVHLTLESHLQEIQVKLNQKAKIQDLNELSALQPSKKKMTRAALAKRNQQTQQQLRKDQIYVRLTPKTQSTLQWMLYNRNFPRIQCKLSCNQHLEYLITYLTNKWLRGKGQQRIVLYPESGGYLKMHLNNKDREILIKEPLNHYLMFTDVMVASGISQNGVLNLTYDVSEKKKEVSRNLTIQSNSLANASNVELSAADSARKATQKQASNQKNLQQKKLNNLKKQTFARNQFQKRFCSQQKNQIFSLKKVEQIDNNSYNINNDSNILNANHNAYQYQESIFKSIGFFGYGGNGNSIGFNRKHNDDNMMSINSNNYLDIQPHQSKNFNSKYVSLLSNKQSIQQPIKQSNKKVKGFSQVKQDQYPQTKHHQKLTNLRNAINFLQQAQGFNVPQGTEQTSQKSTLKQIKTVSIKKKAAN